MANEEVACKHCEELKNLLNRQFEILGEMAEKPAEQRALDLEAENAVLKTRLQLMVRDTMEDWGHKKNYVWKPVVFSHEVYDDGECPECHGQYEECDCPGPTMNDEYEYAEINGKLFAKKL